MKLFSKQEVNKTRQFEFDFAKAVCILGMVLVHCLQEMPLKESAYEGAFAYVVLIVLNCIFGAGTFMVCLGIGLTYTRNNKPSDFIKRGLTTFLLGYLLNVIRYILPSLLYFVSGEVETVVEYLISCALYVDIMQFAGLAFMLFGLLKLIKLPDYGIAILALAMSICGSFVRFIEMDNIFASEALGLFVGTINYNELLPFTAPFPLLNWFIVAIFGYFWGKAIKRCQNIEKFYAISTIISGIIIITYLAITIPNGLGMMSGDTDYYYHLSTFDALVIITGAIFAFGVFHYIAFFFGEGVKKLITSLSININKTYCIHWVIVGWISIILWIVEEQMDTYFVIIMALMIYLLSSSLAELVKRINDKKIKKNTHKNNCKN